MVRPSRFEITQVAEGAGVRLSVEGELDMRTIGELSERVAEQRSQGATELTLDLRELAFMDSSGLRLLIELRDRAREEGWLLRLVSPRRETAALELRSTGADVALRFVEE